MKANESNYTIRGFESIRFVVTQKIYKKSIKSFKKQFDFELLL